MRQGAVIHHLRHIACLGLGDRLAIPLMIESLDRILPSSFINFMWLDEHEQPADMYLPTDVPAPLDIYLSPSDAFDVDSEPTVSNVLAMGRTVGGNESWNHRPGFHRSVLYNEICRPHRIGAGLDLVMRTNGRARGILFVNREPQAGSAFRAGERHLLASLESYFLHAMKASDWDGRVDSEPEDFGLMTVDAVGTVLFASPTVPRLLRQFDPALDWRRPQAMPEDIPLEILMLVRRLIAAERHRAGAPPSLTRRTAWGTIEIRVYPQADLAGAEGRGGGRAFGVVIERRIPRDVPILRKLRALDLSPRQREIAYELAIGRQATDIRARLGLTLSTWRDYLKRIYERTEVHSAAEFQALFD